MNVKRKKPGTPEGAVPFKDPLDYSCSTNVVSNPTDKPKKATFLLMKHSEDGKSLSGVSPFLIHKTVTNVIGIEPLSLKKLRSGNVLIEVKTEAQALKLCSTTSLSGQVPIIVESHPTLNAVRGVIRCQVLQGLEDAEILSELSPLGVSEVKCLTKPRPDSFRPHSYLLTFTTPELPPTIPILRVDYPIQPYFPRPIRCAVCYKYGHGRCSKPARCPHCSQEHAPAEDGTYSNCSEPAKCASCNGDHDTRSSACPRYQQEVRVLRHSIRNQMTLSEARNDIKVKNEQRRQARPVSNAVSFANAAASRNHSDQLDLSNFPQTISATVKSVEQFASSQSTYSNVEQCQPSQQSSSSVMNNSASVITRNEQSQVRDVSPPLAKSPQPESCPNCATLLSTIPVLTTQMSQVLGILSTLLTTLTGDSTKNTALEPASIKLLTAVKKQVNNLQSANKIGQPGTSKKNSKIRSQNAESTGPAVRITSEETAPTVIPLSSHVSPPSSNDLDDMVMEISPT